MWKAPGTGTSSPVRVAVSLWVDTPTGPRACAELGLALGRLHGALAGLSAPAAGPHLALLADPGAALRAAYAAHDHGACAHTTARQALAAKLRCAEALSGTVLETLASLPQQVIHGDVHPGDVLASRSPGTCGISLIDFDCTRYAPPAYEVMRAPLYCVKPSGSRSAFEDGAEAFLGGYLAAGPLSGREIETMAVRSVPALGAGRGSVTCSVIPGGRRCPPPRGRMGSLVVARDRLR